MVGVGVSVGVNEGGGVGVIVAVRVAEGEAVRLGAEVSDGLGVGTGAVATDSVRGLVTMTVGVGSASAVQPTPPTTSSQPTTHRPQPFLLVELLTVPPLCFIVTPGLTI